MIPSKLRGTRRVRSLKLSKKLERYYKDGKCRECSVMVTRMDFAKILGKFTKVKIQYESSTTPKTRLNQQTLSPNSNSRLKSNENGMVLIRRNAYNPHPVKELLSPKKQKDTSNRQVTNILKENNRIKKQIETKVIATYDNRKKGISANPKLYGVIFVDPSNGINSDMKSKVTLSKLLPLIDNSILPSEDWCIDYFPKNDEPKDDKVYDRIAAELEDLMYNNEKQLTSSVHKAEPGHTKVDEFPSIMDILNDNTTDTKPNVQLNCVELKSNLESSDVEAMLLGESNSTLTENKSESMAMEVDNSDMSNLIADVGSLNAISEEINTEINTKPKEATEHVDIIDNPQSPSILDEALQKGIEEHLPCGIPKQTPEELPKNDSNLIESECKSDTMKNESVQVEQTNPNVETNDSMPIIKDKYFLASKTGITELIFKITKDGICHKSVTCPKNLKYSIELEGKSVEFVGAPKFISSLEDLQVLLQIVNESNLSSLHVIH